MSKLQLSETELNEIMQPKNIALSDEELSNASGGALLTGSIFNVGDKVKFHQDNIAQKLGTGRITKVISYTAYYCYNVEWANIELPEGTEFYEKQLVAA